MCHDICHPLPVALAGEASTSFRLNRRPAYSGCMMAFGSLTRLQRRIFDLQSRPLFKSSLLQMTILSFSRFVRLTMLPSVRGIINTRMPRCKLSAFRMPMMMNTWAEWLSGNGSHDHESVFSWRPGLQAVSGACKRSCVQHRLSVDNY